MTNLTPSEARRLIDKLHHNQTKEHGISILEEKYLAALEIALPVLERQGKEQHIGVWNPSTKEIAVNHTSGIKLVDLAHWHCHCTMEVIVREMCDHPAVKERNAQIEPQTDTYRQIENDGGKKCCHKND